MSPRPSPRPSKLLRQALRRAFPSVAVFDAFCLDHFPAIYQQFSPGMDRTIKENLLLQQADPDVLEPLLPPAAELDLARPDPLLSRVIAATRLRYRRLQDPQSAEDPQVTLLDAPPSLRALLQVSFSLSERPTHLGVVVLAEPPALPQLDVIRDALDAHGLRTGQALPCLVVCTQRGFVPTPALQAACDALPLRLYSLEEYEGLIDFSRLLPKQTHELGQSIDYPPALYVDQRLEYCEDGSFRFDQHPPAESAIDKVVSWLADPSRPRFVLLIGDFGHGKTFLLREVCRRLGDPQHAPAVPLIPLYCELRELEKARRLEELLVQYLARHREQLRSPDPDALLHMLSLGRVVLFFDGFDELALRTTYDRAAEHLNTLLQAVSAPRQRPGTPCDRVGAPSRDGHDPGRSGRCQQPGALCPFARGALHRPRLRPRYRRLSQPAPPPAPLTPRAPSPRPAPLLPTRRKPSPARRKPRPARRKPLLLHRKPLLLHRKPLPLLRKTLLLLRKTLLLLRKTRSLLRKALLLLRKARSLLRKPRPALRKPRPALRKPRSALRKPRPALRKPLRGRWDSRCARRGA